MREIDLGRVQGPKGERGDPGETGSPGPAGTSIHVFTTEYSYPQEEIDRYGKPGHQGTWKVAEDVSEAKIGDVVLFQVHNNTKKGSSFIIATATYIYAYSNTISATSSGLLDKGEPGAASGNLNFVTPEEFGAKGDGYTDDTAAFQAAIDSKQRIVCKSGRVYSILGKLIAKNSVLYLDGNGCQFKGFQIDINSVDGTGWVDQYKSYEAVIKNCTMNQFANKPYGIFMAGPLRLENIDIINYTEFLKMSANYLDNFSAFGVTHYVPEGTTNYVTFNLMGGLGDKYLIERCHFVKVKAWGKQPITFLQCLNGGFEGRSSQANFIGCHLEHFTCGNLDMCELRFDSCYIWASVELPQEAIYDKCVFIVHWMTNNNNNNFRKLNTTKCKIYIHQNETTGYQSLVELDSYKKNTNTFVSVYAKCMTFNSKGGSIKFNGETGSYVYTAYPSISPDTINGFQNENKMSYVGTFTKDGTTPLFLGNANFDGLFFHIIRLNPDGSYSKVVIPYAYYVIDTGSSLNGILWEKTDGIPSITPNQASLVNGIYVSDNGNVNGNGILVYNKTSQELMFKD